MNKVPDWQIVNDITILLESRIDQAEKMRDDAKYNENQQIYFTGKCDALKVILESLNEMKKGKSLAKQLIEMADSILKED